MDFPQEIIDDFCQETFDLTNQLETILEDLEDNFSKSEKLEEYGQIIDRIMGAAKSLELKEMSTFCELGKQIGYKSSQVKDEKLISVVVAILFDTTELVRKMAQGLKNGQGESVKNISSESFISRLKWLSSKFNHIERSSCKPNSESDGNLNQNSIDDLLSDLGL